MNFDTFKQDALRTESRPERLQVNPGMLAGVMLLAVNTAKLMDLFKKGAFYGKKIDDAKLETLLNNLIAVAQIVKEHQSSVNDVEAASLELFDSNGNEVPGADIAARMNLRVAHAFVGAASEAGELIEALLDAIMGGQPLDAVNVSEEFGDIDWYKAVAFDELQLSEEASREAVLAKLKARYGDKFDVEKAVNRDLATERALLESHVEAAAG
jgi:hypothetical protein